MNRRRKSTVLSLFTGAGGLDLGLEAAGFKIKLCVEMDAEARETIKINRPRWTLANPSDIHDLTPEHVLEQAGVRRKQLTLLSAGPPCQPFSKSRYWRGSTRTGLCDPRSQTLNALMTLVGAALPEVILIENVKGIAFSKTSEGIELLENEIRRINKKHKVNYVPYLVELNSADYGVPQLRERIFLIAHREGKPFVPPLPTHFPVDSQEKLLGEPYRTAWDAIGDLDNDDYPGELKGNGRWGPLLPSIPEGKNYLWHTTRGGGTPLFGWRTRYWSFLLKLAKDRPSWTIQAEPGPSTGPFHWKSRRLSVRELCRLQTFPDDYEIHYSSYRSGHRQVGNAVPPLVGELLGKEIHRQLLGHKIPARLSLVIARRKYCPPPEQCKRVPPKFAHLRGEHQDHPGVGKGPAARRRYLRNR